MRDTAKRALCSLALVAVLALPGCAGSALIAAQGPAVDLAALPDGLAAAGAVDSAGAEARPAGAGESESAGAVPDPAPEEGGALYAAPGLNGNSGNTAQALAIWSGLQRLRQTVLDHPVRLAVPNILQNPELPNGCEITSAAVILNYLGVPADKVTLAEQYLPKNADHLKADPERQYMGSPFAGEVGYYCMPGPVATAVDRYLADAGESGLRAQDISGADIPTLQQYLHAGTPVMVWVTQHFEEPRYAGHFTLPDGSQPYVNLHCVVLTGYDNGKFYLTDPLAQAQSVSEDTFITIYETMGRRALVIVPR